MLGKEKPGKKKRHVPSSTVKPKEVFLESGVGGRRGNYTGMFGKDRDLDSGKKNSRG